MLTQFPNGLVAVVSDSYDVWNACENIWGDALKDLIVERGERNSALIVRPDSGDPPTVVVKVSFPFLTHHISFLLVFGFHLAKFCLTYKLPLYIKYLLLTTKYI